MIKLNLLPDVKLEYLRTKRTQARVIGITTIVTLAVIALMVVLAIFVYGVQAFQKTYLTSQIKERGAELQAIPDIDQYLTIQNQLANITALHESKNDFSRLLRYLPVLNPSAPNNITLTNVELVADPTGNILTLQGEAKNYTALTTFRDTLLNAQSIYTQDEQQIKEKLFEDVKVVSSTLEQSSGGAPVTVFRLDTIYNPNAFLYSVESPSVSVPIKTTTQSAQSSPDVFGESSVRENQ